MSNAPQFSNFKDLTAAYEDTRQQMNDILYGDYWNLWRSANGNWWVKSHDEAYGPFRWKWRARLAKWLLMRNRRSPW